MTGEDLPLGLIPALAVHELAVLAGLGMVYTLPAVHDPAAVRQPRQNGPAPARGRRRSGATPYRAFWKVTVPLSAAGIIAG